jgi:hypothetical protein
MKQFLSDVWNSTGLTAFEKSVIFIAVLTERFWNMFENFMIGLLEALDEATSFRIIYHKTADIKAVSFHPGIFWIILLLCILIAHFTL